MDEIPNYYSFGLRESQLGGGGWSDLPRTSVPWTFTLGLVAQYGLGHGRSQEGLDHIRKNLNRSESKRVHTSPGVTIWV